MFEILAARDSLNREPDHRRRKKQGDHLIHANTSTKSNLILGIADITLLLVMKNNWIMSSGREQLTPLLIAVVCLPFTEGCISPCSMRRSHAETQSHGITMSASLYCLGDGKIRCIRTTLSNNSAKTLLLPMPCDLSIAIRFLDHDGNYAWPIPYEVLRSEKATDRIICATPQWTFQHDTTPRISRSKDTTIVFVETSGVHVQPLTNGTYTLRICYAGFDPSLLDAVNDGHLDYIAYLRHHNASVWTGDIELDFPVVVTNDCLYLAGIRQAGIIDK